LNGHTDVALGEAQPEHLNALAAALSDVDQVITSPAKRCVETAQLIWGQGRWPTDTRLREQNFGDWEGQPYAELPDVGELDQEAMAAHKPPGGESFLDLCARVEPALRQAVDEKDDTRPLVIVAHAGVIRAALALALGAPAHGLRFEIAHLSVTRLRCMTGGDFSVIATNWTSA
jgi:alpha-ribazole phosphatase